MNIFSLVLPTMEINNLMEQCVKGVFSKAFYANLYMCNSLGDGMSIKMKVMRDEKKHHGTVDEPTYIKTTVL